MSEIETGTATGVRPWEGTRDRSGWLPFDAYLTLMRGDTARLREVAEQGLEPPVPSCPGWSVGDLVAHTAEVYAHKVECTRLGRPPEPWPPQDLAGQQPLVAFDAAAGRLFQLFDTAGPEDPSHTWWPPDQTVGFWMRRMALETAVHRLDAELGHGVPTPVDAALALDGIDELLVMMLAGDEWAEYGTEVPVDAAVRVTSAGRSWTVDLTAQAVTVDRSADGEVAVEISGEPGEVYRWLWGRGGTESLAMGGAVEVAGAFRSRIAEATQ